MHLPDSSNDGSDKQPLKLLQLFKLRQQRQRAEVQIAMIDEMMRQTEERIRASRALLKKTEQPPKPPAE